MSQAITLRPYQQQAIDSLYLWWVGNPRMEDIPIMVVPTGGGKSIILAELCRLLWDTWPEDNPRVVMLVPSKELAEQNADKLAHLMPSHRTIGYYSASLGRKCPDADIIVATIGSIYKQAHRLGNIKCVLIDEAHLCNPNGAEAGRYRQFLTDLARYCTFRTVGCTATPFRGDGVWLTDGESPLFTGIAHEIRCGQLLANGYLSPLVPPSLKIETRIDTDGIGISSTGDYKINDLSDRVRQYLPAVADEACKLAFDRCKWIAFTATVANAELLCELLNDHSIATVVVCGETPKNERAESIERFRAGEIRCLVTVTALATGFDVPDVDCIVWCRPTRSPVLFVQGAGRGLRIAPNKSDCLWLDFSDTTERLGPVDSIRGRSKPKKREDASAPFKLCGECGNQVRPANALVCPFCGAELRNPEEKEERPVSTAPIMLNQLRPKLNEYQVDDIQYSVHKKAGSPDSLRVDYYSGMRRIASEWVCFEHKGFARAKAEKWWRKRGPSSYECPKTTIEACCIAEHSSISFPSAITVNESGKYPEIVSFHWKQDGDIAA